MDTAILLESLQNDLNTLKTNVAAKGVGVVDSDNFTTLATKVATISGGGATDIYRVKSIAERDTLQPNEGDICVVYDSIIGNWQSNTQASNMTFPETVELPDAYKGDYFGRLRKVNEGEEGYFDGNITLMEQRFILDGWGDNFNLRVFYYSEDGIIYNRQEFRAEDMETGDNLVNGDTVNLPFEVKLDNEGAEFDKTLGYFMQTGGTTFGGIFSYRGGSWSYMDIGIDGISGSYLTGSKGYTSDGVITGTFPQGTKKDLNFLVNNRVGTFTITSGRGLFESNTNLTELGFTLDTSNVTDMSNMFNDCSNLTSLDLSNFNTSKVTSMINMFRNCSSLTSIDVSKFNTSNVTTMQQMFYGCINLTDISFGNNFNTSKVEYTNDMFTMCRNISSLDLSSWDLQNLRQTSSMFNYCDKLKWVTFDTSKSLTSLVNAKGMFSSCSLLEELDLSFLGNVQLPYGYYYVEYQNMFLNCSSLKRLNLCNLHLPRVGSGILIDPIKNLFSGCTSLEYLDIRSFDFTIFSDSNTGIFGSISNTSIRVPSNCLIIVKDTANKNWITSKYSWLTNVKTIAEYEAS